MTEVSTENIRDAWIGHSLSTGRAHGTTSRQISDNAARAFDTWLDQQRAAAWDEGNHTAHLDLFDDTTPNPYRERERP